MHMKNVYVTKVAMLSVIVTISKMLFIFPMNKNRFIRVLMVN